MAKEDKNNKIIEDQNSSASSIKTKLEDKTIKKDYSSLNDFRIEIRPIEDRKGVREYSKELEMVASKHVIAPYLQGGSNMFATGLNDDDLEYLAEQKCPYDLNPIYQEGKPSFWLSQMIKIELPVTPLFLHPYRSILDFLKWKYLLVSSYVYKNKEEIKTGSKTGATHYIYNESEDIQIKAAEIESKQSLAIKLSKLTLEKKRNLILIIFNENTENKDDNYLSVRLDDAMQSKDTKEKLEYLLVEDDSLINLKALIKKAVGKNVIRRTKEGYFHFENNLGVLEEDVIKYLLKPTSQEVLLSIQTKI